MSPYFFDSSAAVKRYVNETGSDYIENLADSRNRNIIVVARITQVEVAAALARRLKAVSLTQSGVDDALRLFQHDLTNNYFVIEITKEVLDRAMALATKHALRGYDAVQLAARLSRLPMNEPIKGCHRSCWFRQISS